MNQRIAALALAKTIEHLAEKNLILEDSLALSYDGHTKMNPWNSDEVEGVAVSFQCIKGFAETFRKEYNRLREYNFDVKKTDAGVEVKTDWLE